MTRTDARIALKHGAGGPAMRSLIERLFVAGAGAGPKGGIGLAQMDDGAAVPIGDRWLVITTDSHVVHPIFFPGGDIGRLAVAGTVNDLAVMGATEVLALTCGIIVEEGFPLADLSRVQASLRTTCAEADAPILTGDTKVMGRGELDGLVINTSGVALTDRVISDAGLRAGDQIVVSGTVGDHGLAILALRDGIDLSADLRSDVAPIGSLIGAAIAAVGDDIVAMKDPTRGGLASALSEMAAKAGVSVIVQERSVPVRKEVAAAAGLFGIDPLHVANEGKAVIGVRPAAVDRLLAALRAHPQGADAAVIGRVSHGHQGSVILDTGLGRRLLTEPEGELLPRIC